MIHQKTVAVLVDDEKNNLDYLQMLLGEHCPGVQVSGMASDAVSAIKMIRELKPGLVFMDIDMPGLNGFDLLKELEPVSFRVVFVTAFHEFALKAFDVNAAAYITKPIVAEKLRIAVDRACVEINEKKYTRHISSLLENARQQPASDMIPLPTMQGLVFVRIGDICYCESNGNYTVFNFTDRQPIMVSRQLGEYEKLLPHENFIRIHDKYIISLGCISEYIKGAGGEVKMADGSVLPVSSRRKEEFLSLFGKWLRRK